MRWLTSATACGIKTLHQQNPPVLKWRCLLMQIDLYNGRKTDVVIVVYLLRIPVRPHTHTRLTALYPEPPGWAGTRKIKPIWIWLKQETVSGSGISWAIRKSAPRSRQITTPAPHHSVFLQAGSCRPTNSVKALSDQLSQNLPNLKGWLWLWMIKLKLVLWSPKGRCYGNQFLLVLSRELSSDAQNWVSEFRRYLPDGGSIRENYRMWVAGRRLR